MYFTIALLLAWVVAFSRVTVALPTASELSTRVRAVCMHWPSICSCSVAGRWFPNGLRHPEEWDLSRLRRTTIRRALRHCGALEDPRGGQLVAHAVSFAVLARPLGTELDAQVVASPSLPASHRPGHWSLDRRRGLPLPRPLRSHDRYSDVGYRLVRTSCPARPFMTHLRSGSTAARSLSAALTTP